MNKFFKRLTRMMAIIILCLTCSSWTTVDSSTTSYISGHSTCDEDIQNLKINVDEYSSYENKLILMAEVEKTYLILYFYNANKNNNYKSLDFNYGSTELESDLNDLDLSHKMESITLLSTSTDGLVDKLLVNFSTSGKYRKYELRQLTYGVGTSSYIIGDSYIFTDNSSGGVDYEISKLDYITFEDVKIYDYYIDESDFGSGFFSSYNGQHVYFYGFSLTDLYNFLIHDLEAVTFSYYEEDLDAIMYPEGGIASPDLPIFTNDDYEYQLHDYVKNSLFWWEDQELNFTTKYTNKTFVDEETVEGRTYTVESPSMFFSKTTNSWNSIMKYSDIENVVEGETLKTRLLEDFKNYDYIICMKTYSYEMDKKGFFLNPYEHYALRGIDVNISSKYQYALNFTGAGDYLLEPTFDYDIYFSYLHIYNTKSISEAQIIRMFFRDILGNPYDLEVITTPQNSSGSTIIDGNENPSWIDDLIQTIIAIMCIVVIVILLISYFPYVWKFLVFIFKKFIPFIKKIVVGIFEFFKTIFVGIFNFFKKLFTGNKNKKKE